MPQTQVAKGCISILFLWVLFFAKQTHASEIEPEIKSIIESVKSDSSEIFDGNLRTINKHKESVAIELIESHHMSHFERFEQWLEDHSFYLVKNLGEGFGGWKFPLLIETLSKMKQLELKVLEKTGTDFINIIDKKFKHALNIEPKNFDGTFKRAVKVEILEFYKTNEVFKENQMYVFQEYFNWIHYGLAVEILCIHLNYVLNKNQSHCLYQGAFFNSLNEYKKQLDTVDGMATIWESTQEDKLSPLGTYVSNGFGLNFLGQVLTNREVGIVYPHKHNILTLLFSNGLPESHKILKKSVEQFLFDFYNNSNISLDKKIKSILHKNESRHNILTLLASYGFCEYFNFLLKLLPQEEWPYYKTRAFILYRIKGFDSLRKAIRKDPDFFKDINLQVLDTEQRNLEDSIGLNAFEFDDKFLIRGRFNVFGVDYLGDDADGIFQGNMFEPKDISKDRNKDRYNSVGRDPYGYDTDGYNRIGLDVENYSKEGLSKNLLAIRSGFTLAHHKQRARELHVGTQCYFPRADDYLGRASISDIKHYSLASEEFIKRIEIRCKTFSGLLPKLNSQKRVLAMQIELARLRYMAKKSHNGRFRYISPDAENYFDLMAQYSLSYNRSKGIELDSFFRQPHHSLDVTFSAVDSELLVYPSKFHYEGQEAMDAGGLKKDFYQNLKIFLTKSESESPLIWSDKLGYLVTNFLFSKPVDYCSNKDELTKVNAYNNIGKLIAKSIIVDNVTLGLKFSPLILNHFVGKSIGTIEDSLAMLKLCDSEKFHELWILTKMDEESINGLEIEFFDERENLIKLSEKNLYHYLRLKAKEQLYLQGTNYISDGQNYFESKDQEKLLIAMGEGFLEVLFAKDPSLIGNRTFLMDSSLVDLVLNPNESMDLGVLKTFIQGPSIYKNWLFEIMDEWFSTSEALGRDKVSRLLYFWTSNPFLPADAPLNPLKLQLTGVHPGANPDLMPLPLAHTCFNTLDIAHYPSKALFKKKLEQAISLTGDAFAVF